jgi:hypothetical protein
MVEYTSALLLGFIGAHLIGVGKGCCPPRPPNRTGGFPASGSPVGGCLIGSVSQHAGRVIANSPASAKKALASLDAVTSADTMRSIERSASAHKHRQPVRASAPCLALAGTRGALCAGSVFRASTSLPCLPSARLCFTRLSRPSPQRYYAGCDSCPARTHRTGLSASFDWPSEHPAPNHVLRPSVALSVTSARSIGPCGPGFATDEQARRHTPPNRVRSPAGCSFASGCSPPRLAATQLPSATCAVTSHDKGLPPC